jgi:hypothetical protein
MKICPKCQVDHNKKGTFCSRKCANSRSWSEQDKQKKSIALKNSPKLQLVLDTLKTAGERGRQTMEERGYIRRNAPTNSLQQRTCPICNIQFFTRKKSKKYCGTVCVRVANKLRNNTPEGRARLRDIGRNGGFGKKGYTKNGTYYQSSIEKQCFEYLEDNNILFEAHKPIPNSTKISDCYIAEVDLWIEIDGIDRDKKQKWLQQEYRFWINKLDIYKENNLNFCVVKSFDEFKNLLGWRIG